MIAFMFENKLLQDDFEKYFTFKSYKWKYDYGIQDYLYKDYFELEKCTEKHFPSDLFKAFNELNLQTAFCIPLEFKAEISKNT